MTTSLTGLSGLAGINAIAESDPFATPEERMGGPANPYHAHIGEQAKPYSYMSQMTPAGSHGPYGLDNQLLGDDMWFIEPSGEPESNPQFDFNSPSLTRSHASVRNITRNGPVPSQADAINLQVAQMDNKLSDLGTSRKMTHSMELDPKNDTWEEIWNVDDGSSDVPPIGKPFSHQANGFGVNDAATNMSRKVNLFGYGDKHMHRRYATGHIPGNFMWMRPQGRPLFKTIAGPARPPVGGNSPFAGQDIGFSFDPYGAVLMSTPEEYIPPPSPNIESRTASYDNPYGTDETELW